MGQLSLLRRRPIAASAVTSRVSYAHGQPHYPAHHFRLLDDSRIEQLSVDDLRNMTPAVWQQLDRLNRISDKLYIHIDMDVLDPREVMAHGP
jgi:arginase family enzyme